MAVVLEGFVKWIGDYEKHVGRVPKGGPSPSGNIEFRCR